MCCNFNLHRSSHFKVFHPRNGTHVPDIHNLTQYIKVLQNDMLKTKLQDKFFEVARREKVDTYVNRLFITAEK